MSALRLKAAAQNTQLSQKFIEGSKNKIHLTPTWGAAVRYAQHMLALKEKLHGEDSVPLDAFPAILRVELPSGIQLKKDPDDDEGVIYQQKIPIDKIWVLVNERLRNDTGCTCDTDDFKTGGNCKWLPVSKWDPTKYVPAYPDDAGPKGNESWPIIY